MSADPWTLHLTKQSSDVTLVVDGTEFPVHRSILSERSEYFRTMFSTHFVEFSSDKIILKEVNLFAFEKVLEYIYTRRYDFIYHCTDDSACQVYMCAQYFMVNEFVEYLRKYLKDEIKYKFPLRMWNSAHLYHANDLILYGVEVFAEKAPFEITKHSFEQLSPVTVRHLLKLRLNTDDFIIFEALVSWMQANPDYLDWFPEILKQFDLYLLDEQQLEVLFEPMELVDRNVCLSLLTQQREQAMDAQKVVNENVIDPTGYRLVKGKRNVYEPMAVELLNGTCIIDLKQLFLINCIKLIFNRPFSYFYTVLVSRDMREWEKVVDYSNYSCSYQQQLYFDERPVRFVRIETSDTSTKMLIEKIEVLYSTDHFEVDPETNLTIPEHDVVQTLHSGFNRYGYGFMPYTITDRIQGRNLDYGHRRIRNRLDDPTNGHIGHKLGSLDGIVYKFEQPYIISSMKLLLNDESSYYIAISTNDADWTRVFAEENVSGWRIATFEKQPVLYIRIYGTNAPSDFFNLYKLECPATF